MGKNREFSKFPNAITVLDNGNVGIGTSNPTGTLEISKANSGGIGAYLFLRNSTATAANNAVQISFSGNSGGDATTPTAAIRVTEASNAAASIGFYTYDGTSVGERFKIDSNGVARFKFASDRGIRMSGTLSTESVLSSYQVFTENIRELRIAASTLFINTGNGSDSTGTERVKITETGRVEVKTEGIVSQKGASGTVGGGSFIGLQQTAAGGGERWMLQQLNSSYGLDYWSYNGSSWSVISKLSSGGTFTIPNQPSATVGLTSAFSTAGATIIWQQVHNNIGNCYNSSTGLFTCPVTGKYLISVMCMTSYRSSPWWAVTPPTS